MLEHGIFKGDQRNWYQAFSLVLQLSHSTHDPVLSDNGINGPECR